jgi:hypothetical protein
MKVTFKSDSEADFACLENHLRTGAFGDLPDAWRHQAEQDLSLLRETMEALASRTSWIPKDVRDKFSELIDLHLPTRYDSPTQYRILSRLVTRIRDSADVVGLNATDFPHYACIPTGVVNASAVALPDAGRPFLLFDSELFLYCHLFAKAFARCLPVIQREPGNRIGFSTDITKVSDRIDSTPELANRFADLLSAYASTGTASKSQQYDPESDYIGLVDVLRDGMELFVVAHEFGHVYAGHLSEVLRRYGATFGLADIENDSHRHEHEADLIGLLLTLQAMAKSGYDAGLSYVGIELFFVSLEMASRATHIQKYGDDQDYDDAPSATHPSNEDRRALLRATLDHMLDDSQDAENARKMAEAYEEIALLLWRAAQITNPSFARITRNGR